MNRDGHFYLGKEYSPGNDEPLGKKYLYDASDLTTHGVVFGMTGSGKTGLCIDLLEEAVNEDVPIIIVDPKGDVANLALIFPELAPKDFKNWVSPTQAQQEGKDIDTFAAQMAERWQKGLSSWGIEKENIQSLKEKLDLKIFTPGSSAGLPVSIIQGFKAPNEKGLQDEERMLERIRNTVSALLSLLGISGDPLTSQPHILISKIIEHYWRMSRDVSMEELIINIQKPPFQKMGVFDINQLIDEKERIELAFKINNIIASPGFRFWKTGMPLSAGNLFEKRGNKVPVNVFYIAHLSENERMFFLSLLLNEIVDWIRQQPGATDLKYLFYMDEIYGYLPPYPLNPPSKNPLMILMKQARAFGLGVVLVTQNPKDIDYKALTNTGTWFIGKLQAETDRERVMEGMRGVLDASGESLDTGEINKLISSLKKRVFLVKNVHEAGVKIFHTRWAISYLAGPLTRDQIKELVTESVPRSLLMEQQSLETTPSVTVVPPPIPGDGTQISDLQLSTSDLLPFPPQAEVFIQNVYESIDNSQRQWHNNANKSDGRKDLNEKIKNHGMESIIQEGVIPKFYSPFLYFQGQVIFDDSKLGIYIRKKFYSKVPLKEALNWEEAEIESELNEYSTEPESPVLGFEPLKIKLNFTTLRRMQMSFKNHLYSQLSLKLLVNQVLKLYSDVDESKESFKIRCRDAVEKLIDKEIEKIKDSYQRKIERLEDRIEREKIKVKKLKREVRSKRTEEFISIGESVLGVILGSKSIRGLSTAARRRRSSSSSADRLELGKTKLSQLEEDILQLQEELENKIADIEDQYYEKADEIEELTLRLEKNDIVIAKQSLLWKLMPRHG